MNWELCHHGRHENIKRFWVRGKKNIKTTENDWIFITEPSIAQKIQPEQSSLPSASLIIDLLI